MLLWFFSFFLKSVDFYFCTNLLIKKAFATFNSKTRSKTSLLLCHNYKSKTHQKAILTTWFLHIKYSDVCVIGFFVFVFDFFFLSLNFFICSFLHIIILTVSLFSTYIFSIVRNWNLNSFSCFTSYFPTLFPANQNT